jgi:AcrR family transcriptional regulator
MLRPMSASAGRRYHHGNLRSAVLDAGTRIVDRDGPEALTFRSCAREAGVSHAAPAHHVGDLRGLRTALAARFWDDLGAHLEQAMVDHGRDPHARLQVLCEAYVGFATRFPHRYQVMIRCDALDGADPELIRGYHRAKDPLVTCVAALHQRPPDPADLLLVWSATHGLAGLIIAGAAGPGSGGPGATTPPADVFYRLVTGLGRLT